MGLTYLAKNGHVLDEHSALVGGPALYEPFSKLLLCLCEARLNMNPATFV